MELNMENDVIVWTDFIMYFVPRMKLCIFREYREWNKAYLANAGDYLEYEYLRKFKFILESNLRYE